MFARFKLYLFALIPILAAVVWFEHSQIKQLTAVKNSLVLQIEQKTKQIAKLQQAAKQNERLTFELSQFENKQRSDSHAIIRSIPQSVKSTPCFNSPSPKSIVDFLRKGVWQENLARPNMSEVY